MATVYKMVVNRRDPKVKARKFRNEKLIPAEVYGPALKENKHINIPYKELESMLEKVSETTLIELNVKGEDTEEKVTCFVKSVQRHKVSDQPIHVDFYVPEEGRKMNLRIPLEFEGEPVGVTQGGYVNIYVHEIPVAILPSDIVDSIKVDISKLKMGESLSVSDIKNLLPKDADALIEDEELVISVIEPKAAEEVVEETEEEEITEPEVIQEKTPQDMKEE
ncbi:50S ribosomal protein L25 [Petrotoga olearia]|uniref:Large ribosomal subunit protein bL25 n=2 Tax=Petrotoga olearia TaxID=156203 RepID=A0A2K1NZW1_9BACT|nr:50S ribosomal protein L25 [Petrotoga olearia]KUK16275.1 MAG: 50S ribosomal protein L25 [Petrotoga mobilis]PNR96017.1 50S ribosomal protein L25 [Petrotoga olearia DSM 13574]RMA71429.1 LSU ribosomal protein L25P [Petrotoga olearia]HBT51230.1 50S ribosomal protein L25 [Petrotoga sp.]